jgi:hypothetical protein
VIGVVLRMDGEALTLVSAFLFRLVNLIKVTAVDEVRFLRRIPSAEDFIHTHELDPREKSAS